MRQAASAAAGLYYAGVNDQASAEANGLIWWPNNKPNEKMLLEFMTREQESFLL